MNTVLSFIYLLLGMSFFSCADVKSSEGNSINDQIDKPTVSQIVPETDTTKNQTFAWISEFDVEDKLINRIPVPEGFQRIPASQNSQAAWLRDLPLLEPGHQVKTYDGRLKGNQRAHYQVVNMDVGKRDLQQCADAVMRLKAEYHYARQEWDKIHFNFTSGDRVAFDDWSKGKKPRIQGSKVSFSAASGSVDHSYSNFKKYLIMIFSYAGTASLEKELISVEVADIQAGDVFIQGGFPGHAVLVLDVAENSQTGEKVFLLGQSYMPAQEFHVLKNPNDSKLNPWYSLSEGENLYTPEWDFQASNLKRFKE